MDVKIVEEIVDMGIDEKRNLLDKIENELNDNFIMPWKISALITEIVELIEENKKLRSMK